MKNNKTLLMLTALTLLSLNLVSAGLVLDSVQFNPAIISAGDTVDIVAQYKFIPDSNNDKIGNPEYSFGVELFSDSSLADKYLTIIDSKGDGYKRTIYSGSYAEVYNQVFKVKLSEAAPAANYELKLVGQWYKNGYKLTDPAEIKFTMPVKKEGISLGIASIQTSPSEVRPGDDFVKVKTKIENSGEKDAKSVKISLLLPEGFSSSYSDNNIVWVGQLQKLSSKDVEFTIDVDDSVRGGVYNLTYEIEYKDSNNNVYTKTESAPIYIKPSPQIEVVEVSGSAKVGSSGKLIVKIKNTGEESAEAVDVRILKQSAQPFILDIRSDYIGELEPNETATAIFNIDVTGSAEPKEYSLKLLIRAKGDSDSGDTNIYSFNRRAKFVVEKRLLNPFVLVGLIGLIAALAYFKLKDNPKIKRRKK